MGVGLVVLINMVSMDSTASSMQAALRATAQFKAPSTPQQLIIQPCSFTYQAQAVVVPQNSHSTIRRQSHTVGRPQIDATSAMMSERRHLEVHSSTWVTLQVLLWQGSKVRLEITLAMSSQMHGRVAKSRRHSTLRVIQRNRSWKAKVD